MIRDRGPLGSRKASLMSRVSAIIIVFNGETYIAEAIDSVLAQDFDD